MKLIKLIKHFIEVKYLSWKYRNVRKRIQLLLNKSDKIAISIRKSIINHDKFDPEYFKRLINWQNKI